MSQGRGKIAAQCCHAAVALWKKMWRAKDPELRTWVRPSFGTITDTGQQAMRGSLLAVSLHSQQPVISASQECGGKTKICLQVESEQQLQELKAAAKEAGRQMQAGHATSVHCAPPSSAVRDMLVPAL